jgi:hypothetical protein
MQPNAKNGGCPPRSHPEEGHKVKKAGSLAVLFMLIISTTGYTWAQETAIPKEFVTAATLTHDDVKTTVGECLAAQGCKLQTVIGIHQEGNAAKVFVEYSYKSGKKTVVVDLVRFNSGRWYNTSLEGFVMKYVSR